MDDILSVPVDEELERLVPTDNWEMFGCASIRAARNDRPQIFAAVHRFGVTRRRSVPAAKAVIKRVQCRE